MKQSFVIKETFEVQPSVIYRAWLDSAGHIAMTGSEAQCGNKVGDPFSAWEGYITGKNLELIADKKIVQSWRTTEFDDQDEDSLLTIELKEIKKGTELIITHSNLPDGQTGYKQGWIDFYFEPMKDYFNQQRKR